MMLKNLNVKGAPEKAGDGLYQCEVESDHGPTPSITVHGFSTKEECIATANLIAAAPEMLEAINFVYAKLGEMKLPLAVECGNALIKAIFKAEGR